MPTFETLTEPAAAFEQPLAVLLSCHNQIRRFCDQLDLLEPYVAEHGVDAKIRQSIESVIRFFDEVTEGHHSDEEEELFPILEARIPSAAPKLEQLAAEHGYLQSRWNAIRDDLQALCQGEHVEISAIEIAEFVRLYRLHAAIEESWLIPTAEQIMTDEEKRLAGQHMASKHFDGRPA